MKARFDVKQPPVKIVENNDEAYVFICLNEEEKEETITYIIYPEEPEEPEDINDDIDPGFSVDPIPDDNIDFEIDDESNNKVVELEEISDGSDVDESSESENTVIVKYYEYDYNEFHDKKNNLDLEDVQAHPENYLDYSPSQKTEEDNLKEDFNSLKARFDEMKEVIERGLVV